MNKLQKNAIYDEMCGLLTDYETQINEGICDGVTEEDLYSMLVKIQNNWEELTGDDED